MASIEALKQADLHRNAMKGLLMSSNPEIRTAAAAVLDNMGWLDNTFSDLKKLFSETEALRADLAGARAEIRRLEQRVQSSGTFH